MAAPEAFPPGLSSKRSSGLVAAEGQPAWPANVLWQRAERLSIACLQPFCRPLFLLGQIMKRASWGLRAENRGQHLHPPLAVFPVPDRRQGRTKRLLQQPLPRPSLLLSLGPPRRDGAPRLPVAPSSAIGSASPAWARCSSSARQGLAACCCFPQRQPTPWPGARQWRPALRWRRLHSWASPDRSRASLLGPGPGGRASPPPAAVPAETASSSPRSRRPSSGDDQLAHKADRAGTP